MKTSFVVLLFLCCALNLPAQSIFFQSAQVYNQGELRDFYASLRLQDSLLLFNAPDYRLYAYDTRNGALQWDYRLGRKSNTAPHFVAGTIWANGVDSAIQLGVDGRYIRTLPFLGILTQPFFRGGVLYATGIHEGGRVFAYDTAKDTILWHRFIAHGSSVRPYYLEDKLVVNGEEDNWLELQYDGRTFSPSCEKGPNVSMYDLPCLKHFTALTHDGKEIGGKLLKQLELDSEETDTYLTANSTLVLSTGKLYTLGRKAKLKSVVNLYELSDTIDYSTVGASKILQVENGVAWLFYGDYLLAYDGQKKVLLKAVDLKRYEPHGVVLDGQRLWFVSRKDGLLYGITID